MTRLFFSVTLILFFVPAHAQAQYVDTWDPDADGDNLIGVNDLIALLAVFAESDYDSDGIWDSDDDCVGDYDECGVCNGPGPQIPAIDYIVNYYDSVYAEAIDEWFVFVVDADTVLTMACENPGCMDSFAFNYDPYAVEADGSCIYDSDIALCGGSMSLEFEGYTYQLTAINNRCYFAENLRSSGGITPSALFELDPNIVMWNGSPPTDSLFVANYGYLYDAFSGTCPEGWHVPTLDEAGGGGPGGGYVTIGGLHNAYYSEQSWWWTSTPVDLENWPYTIGLPAPFYYYGNSVGELHYPAVPIYYYHKTCIKDQE